MEDPIYFPRSALLHGFVLVWGWTVFAFCAALTLVALSNHWALELTLLGAGVSLIALSLVYTTRGVRFFSYGCVVSLPWFRQVHVAWPEVAKISRDFVRSSEEVILYAPGDHYLARIPLNVYRDPLAVLAFLRKSTPQAQWEGFPIDPHDYKAAT